MSTENRRNPRSQSNIAETISSYEILSAKERLKRKQGLNQVLSQSQATQELRDRIRKIAIPETLFENEFFGHAKGTYTDAKFRQVGLLREAEGGTIFLYEISTISPYIQAKGMVRKFELGGETFYWKSQAEEDTNVSRTAYQKGGIKCLK